MFRYLYCLACLFSCMIASAQVVHTLPFRTYRDYILVSAAIDGAGSADWFIFDTGATSTVIDSAFAATHGLNSGKTTEAIGAGGTKRYQLATDQILQFESGPRLANLTLLMVDLTDLRHRIGIPFAGILGYDLLQAFITEVDFESREIRLHTAAADWAGQGWHQQPFSFKNGITIPQFPAEVTLENGSTYRGDILFDSGANLGISINTPFHENHQMLAQFGKTLKSRGQSLTKSSVSYTARVQSVGVAGYAFRDLTIHLATDKAGVSAFKGYLGLLGVDIIRRFNFILDYDQKQLYLKPNRFFTEAFRTPNSGLRLLHDDLGIRIDQVIDDTPAARLGIHPGWRLQQIGQPAEDLETVYQYFYARTGQTVQLQLLDTGGQVKTLMLPLEKLL
jgi:hypothetical protein